MFFGRKRIQFNPLFIFNMSTQRVNGNTYFFSLFKHATPSLSWENQLDYDLISLVHSRSLLIYSSFMFYDSIATVCLVLMWKMSSRLRKLQRKRGEEKKKVLYACNVIVARLNVPYVFRQEGRPYFLFMNSSQSHHISLIYLLQLNWFHVFCFK